MEGRLFILLCLVISLCWPVGAQPETREEITPPETAAQAQALFIQAYNYGKEIQYQKALVRYQVVLEYYRKNKETERIIATLNNMAAIYPRIGKHEKAVELLNEAIKVAQESGDLKRAGELHHKTGILLTQIAEIKEKKAQSAVITPQPGQEEPTALTAAEGTYTRLVQVGSQFKAEFITMEGIVNPYEEKDKPYTKVFNLKVKSDFDPQALVVPDSVELIIQIRKTGYYPIGNTKTLLPDIEYAEFNEKLVAIPRYVKPKIKEDFYGQDTVPDEITLTRVSETTERPTAITDKEPFKPGYYLLSVKKAGYQPIAEKLTLYPGEGPFNLPIRLVSKPRDITYRFQSDVLVGILPPNIEPDEITLNAQPIREGSKVKPGKYTLFVKKDGYEPISKEILITPEERPHQINEVLRALPRQVIYHLVGDYNAEELQPDEITLEGKAIKYGEAIRPESYVVVIRKNGYNILNDRIIIEPKSEPYVLKRNLVSTPRRIDLIVWQSFPAGKRLTPPQIATLGKKSITTAESFKPGEYELVIKHPGFETFTKNINIAPNDQPYRIEETLLARPREVVIEIERDVPPEDADVPTKIYLVNERTKESIEVKSGDKVMPESYMLKIEQPGYEQDVTKHTIYAAEESYPVKRGLKAALRPVVTRVTAEYPLKKQIIPQEITMDSQTIVKDFKIKPGHHDLVIIAEGYMPIREPMDILASPNDYILARELQTRPRLVNFTFTDAYTKLPVEPDQVTLRGKKIMPGEAQNLKPGKYELDVQLSGYARLTEPELEIPVGMGPYPVQRDLYAIKRKFIPNITSEYTKEKLSLEELDLFTLSNLPIKTMIDPNDGNIYVKPGKYDVLIQKKGYENFSKSLLDIPPDPSPYVFTQELITKKRELDIHIRSSFPFAGPEDLVPDTLMLGLNKVKDGDFVKPGQYGLVIKKKGYKDVQESRTIVPAETPEEIAYTLQTLPRKITYKITNDFDQKVTEPDLITIDEKNIAADTQVIPGKYMVKIEKLGYYPKKMEAMIEPSDQDYKIETVLVSMAREIELNITSDYPPDDPIDPDVATLNGTEIAGGKVFKPGQYVLVIQHPGFKPLSEDVLIPPGEDYFVIERMLVSLPRKVEENITFDVLPPEELPPHKITFAPADEPQKETVIKKESEIKPGEYIMRITKEAYETIEKRCYVWAEPNPLVIKETMSAKQVLLLINITYDVKPPEGLQPYTVSLIDKSGIPRFVEHGHRTKPGEYKLKVDRPGYEFGPAKTIYMPPSEQAFPINEKLIAKPRRISFDMVYNDPVQGIIMISAHQIVDNKTGLKVDFKTEFQPGKEAALTIMFEEFKTVNAKFEIVPGEGPFRAPVQMTKLETYDFVVRHEDKKKPPFIELDGIEYEFKFYVDGHSIEPHHIKKEPGPGQWVYTIRAEKDAQNVQGYGGYMYAQKPLDGPKAFPRFNLIAVPQLIEHLDTIIKTPGKGYRVALEVMETGLRNSRWKRMLEQCNPDELKKLIAYIEGWAVPEDLRSRVRVILETLTKMLEGS